MHKSILVIEDDRDISQSVSEVLEDEGFRVVHAGNGREALRLLLSGSRPSAILLDLMMPIMDGWQFRREQLQNADLASIPVVAFSADGDVRHKASALQAAGHVPKPMRIDELLQVMKRVCGIG